MKKLFVILSVIVLPAFLRAQTQPLTSEVDVLPALSQLARIDSLFANWNTTSGPGGVVAVISRGTVLYQKAFGMAHVLKKVSNTPATAFNVASISKQFTAMCIALLEEQGKLSFEDDIRKYFPEFQYAQRITVRNLLQHTSGIREVYVLATLAGKITLAGNIRPKFSTLENYLSLLARQKDLNFEPGSDFAYTNTNYLLLAVLVERVSGMSLRTFADQHIFKSLGMNHSIFLDDPQLPIPTKAQPYRPRRGNEQLFKKAKGRDGGIVGDHNLITTVEDLVRWDQNFYHNRLGKGRPDLIDRMQMKTVLLSGDTINYGFGLELYERQGIQVVSHGGDDDRFTSYMVRFPEHALSVICLTNSSRYDDVFTKSWSTAEIFLPALRKPDTLTPAISGDQPFIALPAEVLAVKAGNYVSEGRGRIRGYRKVYVDQEKLYLSHNPRKKFGRELRAVSDSVFVYQTFNGDFAEVRFERRDSSGAMELRERYREFQPSFVRKTETQPDKQHFRDLLGTYRSEEVSSKIKVKYHGEELKMTFRGIIKIPLIFVQPDLFYAPENVATFRFRRDSAGKVDHFVIDAPDFSNFRFNRR